jgi:hypothetical protein
MRDLSLSLIVLLLVASASAQQVPIDPASTHIFPAGGRRGSTVSVRVGGQCLPPGCRVQWLGAGIKSPDTLGLAAEGHYEPSPRRDPRETPMAHAKEWSSPVEIAADAPLGQKLWRLSSARGGTSARAFVVGDLTEFVETESNSSPERAERVTLPVTINGQIAGERDTDYFLFAAERGETITAELAAARLGSALETVIEIRDAAGHTLPAQSLRAGSDPVLVFTAPASGDYRLFVANLSFRGGAEFVYRVTLSKLPYVAFAFPPVVRAGQRCDVETWRARDSGQLGQLREQLTAPTIAGPAWVTPPAPAANPLALDVSELSTTVEREPNDAREQASELSIDAVVCGQLGTSSDEDWYRFKAAKDQLLSIDCQPAPKTSPALPVVSVVDASGAALVTAKSAEAVDRVIRLDWRAPTDGTFYVRVVDTRHGAAGGPSFIYTLSLREGRPDFALTAKSDIVNVEQGGRAELELNVVRRGGFDGAIALKLEGVPEKVTIEPAEIPPGATTLKIAVIAAPDARAAPATVRLVGSATIQGAPRQHTLAATHQGHDADGVGLGPSTIDNLQLTVAHKPVFKLYCSEAYQYAHRGTVYPYLMQIERLDDFAGPIHLEVCDRQIKDLDGIEVRRMTVEPGQTSFMLPLYLPETMHINIQAHSNVYAQGYVNFTDKFGQPQSHLVVSTMRCMVRTLPPVAKLQAIERSITARPGTTVACPLEVIRTSNFSGPLKIELVSPNEGEGFFANSLVLPANASKTTIPVRIAVEARPRQNTTLTFRATGNMAGGVQVISEATVGLSFE